LKNSSYIEPLAVTAERRRRVPRATTISAQKGSIVMFNASDEKFAEPVVDPERVFLRSGIFLVRGCGSLAFPPIPYLSGSHVMGAGSAFVAALMWILAMKIDTETSMVAGGILNR
jgi:hypothetical protein